MVSAAGLPASWSEPGAGEAHATRRIIAAMALLALVLCLYELSRPNTLFGVDEYDDGAYFGSAVRLANGVLPYRDFVLVQPPGFTLLVAPFGLLSRAIGTRDAFAVARLLMPVVALLNVVLVGLLVRHRGRVATLVATGLMAVYPAEVHANHTLLLEPVLDLFCLLGAVLIFGGDRVRDGGRRLWLGGIALGFAGCIKGWAIIPAAVILVLCLPEVRRRLLPVLGGMVIGFGVPSLPFLLLTPGAFYEQVVAIQLHRLGYSERVAISTRLGDLTGSSSVTPWASLSVMVALVLLVALVGLVVAMLTRPRRRRPTPLEWFLLVSAVATAGLLLAPSEFYDHYAAFFAPFVAMIVGCGVGAAWRQPVARRGFGVLVAIVAVMAINQGRIILGEHGVDLRPTVGRVIPPGACALSDSADPMLTTNRFTSTVPGCHITIVDAYGTTLSLGGIQYQQAVDWWTREINRADYLVFYRYDGNGRVPLVDSIRALLARDFTRVPSAGTQYLYVRHGFPIG